MAHSFANNDEVYLAKMEQLASEYKAAVLSTVTSLESINKEYLEKQILPAMTLPVDVVILKGGEPFDAETYSSVKTAIIKALDALGYEDKGFSFLRFGGEAASTEESLIELVEVSIECADPVTVVCIDEQAAMLCGKIANTKKPLEPGVLQVHRGRNFLYIGQFHEMLSAEAEKRIAWKRLQLIRFDSPIY